MATPSLVEIAGINGFDAVFVDLEHSDYTVDEVQSIVIAADGVGITTVVRPPTMDASLIGRLLDVGTGGIYVPHVTSAAEASLAVSFVRYPPQGRRSMSLSVRAARYGSLDPASVEASAARVVVAVMIEDEMGVRAAKDIAATPGLDLVAVGPLDLLRDMQSRGRPASQLPPAVQQIADDVRQASNARMAFPLMHPALPLSVAELRALGVGYTHCGPVPEVRLSHAYSSDVAAIRAQISEV
jgi:2-keto-3-deoxy-L-rhamnonate aldolase RhmA